MVSCPGTGNVEQVPLSVIHFLQISTRDIPDALLWAVEILCNIDYFAQVLNVLMGRFDNYHKSKIR